ncbi:hypothetical protein, partial [Vibrio nigripulchritudo]|uniref:hypothetical protein n=1 Tax=Vibrio nigripulchritudo TaxID=28173 RepID=UPI001E313A09
CCSKNTHERSTHPRQLQKKPIKTERKFFESLENHLQQSDNVILNLSMLKKHHNDLYLKSIEFINSHPLKFKVINVSK